MITVPGTKVVPVPLFKVLDGKKSEDYKERVEPSETGGKVMAKFMLEIIDQNLNRLEATSQAKAPLSETMSRS